MRSFLLIRRLLVPILLLLGTIVFYRSDIRLLSLPSVALLPPSETPKPVQQPINLHKVLRLPIFNSSENYRSPPVNFFYEEQKPSNDIESSKLENVDKDSAYSVLFRCSRKANRFTGHIRLPNIIQNASQIAPGASADNRVFWNPTIIALPWWSKNQYLVVSRIVTDGHYQENVLCEANVCYVGPSANGRLDEKSCTEDDIDHVGAAGGLRCATAVTLLSVPPTPALHCEGKFTTYADIPGFHDPRIFWSGRGEPLMMVNTQ